MFSKSDLEYLKQSPYDIIQLNNHDATIHSSLTGHDWIIISRYDTTGCHILHRHSRVYPYHRQTGNYRSLREAMDYITDHEEWFANNKM